MFNAMTPKRNHKPIEEAMVVKPTQIIDVPLKTNMEEQEDYEELEDLDDHENKEEQPTIIVFILEQLEVLLKRNRPDFI